MKVKIKAKSIPIVFYLPTSLILSNFGISIALCIAKKYVNITEINKKAVVKQMKKLRKQYKGLTLVEVKTIVGEEVVITL